MKKILCLIFLTMQGNESYHFFSYIKDLKSDVCFSAPNFVRLTSVFEELFIWEARWDKKAGVDDKTGKENLSHHFFIELLLEHVTVNETGAFGIPPDKGNRVQYFVCTLSFYKQPIYKQTVLACWIANVNASP